MFSDFLSVIADTHLRIEAFQHCAARPDQIALIEAKEGKDSYEAFWQLFMKTISSSDHRKHRLRIAGLQVHKDQIAIVLIHNGGDQKTFHRIKAYLDHLLDQNDNYATARRTATLFNEEIQALLSVGMEEFEPGYLLEHGLLHSIWKLQRAASEIGVTGTTYENTLCATPSSA